MNEEKLHKELPIGDNEKILTVVRHHWFAYVSVYMGAAAICLLVLIVMIATVLGRSQLGLPSSATTAIFILGFMFIAGVIAFSFIPVWIKKQEMLVLTEQALLQIKKPSLFASKVSQLNLVHIADVTVNQDTMGKMFGFAHLAIETPGEQDNYEFSVVGDAREKAKMIIEAHENYAAALESGQIQTSLGERPPVPGAAWRAAAPDPAAFQAQSTTQAPYSVPPQIPVTPQQPTITTPPSDESDQE